MSRSLSLRHFQSCFSVFDAAPRSLARRQIRTHIITENKEAVTSPKRGKFFYSASEGADQSGSLCCSQTVNALPTNMPTLDVTDVSALSPSKRPKTESKGETPVLRFAKLSEHATTPTRGSTKAAGFDLYSAHEYSIGAMDKAIVKTDIQIAVPHGYYGRVAPRSGLAAKHFIDVGAGVVDEDYRGNVGVVLFNFSKETFEVKKGDRVAQLVCEKICYPDLVEEQTLDETDRGAGGFGSTGRN